MGNNKGIAVGLGVLSLMIVIIVIATLGSLLSDNTIFTQNQANYAHGDYYLDFNPDVASVQGVDNATGTITCNDATASNNFANCGEPKYVGFVTMLGLLPLLVIVGLFGIGAGSLFTSGGIARNKDVVLWSSVMGVLGTIVAVLFLPIMLPQIDQLIYTLNKNQQTGADLLKLLPMLVVVSILSSSVGYGAVSLFTRRKSTSSSTGRSRNRRFRGNY